MKTQVDKTNYHINMNTDNGKYCQELKAYLNNYKKLSYSDKTCKKLQNRKMLTKTTFKINIKIINYTVKN